MKNKTTKNTEDPISTTRLDPKMPQSGFKSVKGFLTTKQLFQNSDLFKNAKYVTTEHQDYGYRLALQLGDLEHKSLYMRIAKTDKRILVEQALRFAADYPKAQNKAKIFMWKLKELKQAAKEKEQETKESTSKMF